MSTDTHVPRKGPEPPDLSERGGMKGGQPQRSDERLFMQLLAMGAAATRRPLSERALAVPGLQARCMRTRTIRRASASSR
jgi:hypothetical protein